MPTNRTRRARQWSTGLDEYRRLALLEGEGAMLLAGAGYGALVHNGINGWTDADWALVSAEMLADWRRHGAELLAATIATKPGTRPWAWWRFDAPEPLPEGEGDAAYLVRLGLLRHGEMVG